MNFTHISPFDFVAKYPKIDIAPDNKKITPTHQTSWNTQRSGKKQRGESHNCPCILKQKNTRIF